ncbi:hypothetical protein NDN16_05155 [Aureimonas altamirensis]|uniref:hypothetical protein n=1 Tax=Aureimonas altamirensis TaxID=370622 RepID=UPI002036C209|nr:hypothetical protein [Aureimonas altamirensis]MCM2503064.1 hypothetical protein [Aureimonas altamirensis]
MARKSIGLIATTLTMLFSTSSFAEVAVEELQADPDIIAVKQDAATISCVGIVPSKAYKRYMIIRRQGFFDIVLEDFKTRSVPLVGAVLSGTDLQASNAYDFARFTIEYGIYPSVLSPQASTVDVTLKFEDGYTDTIPIGAKALRAVMDKMADCIGADAPLTLTDASLFTYYHFQQREKGPFSTDALAVRLYDGYDGLIKDPEQAGRILAELYEMHGSEMSSLATVALVRAKYHGHGMTADPVAAFALATTKKDIGDEVAVVRARMLRDGIGTAPDLKLARKEFAAVAERSPGLAGRSLVEMMLTGRGGDGPDPMGALTLLRSPTMPEDGRGYPWVAIAYISGQWEGERSLSELKQLLEQHTDAAWFPQLLAVALSNDWLSPETFEEIADRYYGKTKVSDLYITGSIWKGSAVVEPDREEAVRRLSEQVRASAAPTLQQALAVKMMAEAGGTIPDDILLLADNVIFEEDDQATINDGIRSIERTAKLVRDGAWLDAAEALASVKLTQQPIAGTHMTTGQSDGTYKWRAVLDHPLPQGQDLDAFKDHRVEKLLLEGVYLPPAEIIVSTTTKRLRAIRETAVCGSNFGQALKCGIVSGTAPSRELRLLMLAGQFEVSGDDAQTIFDRAAEAQFADTECSTTSADSVVQLFKACSRVPDPLKLKINRRRTIQ